MKVSDLIAELSIEKDQYGDLEAKVYDETSREYSVPHGLSYKNPPRPNKLPSHQNPIITINIK